MKIIRKVVALCLILIACSATQNVHVQEALAQKTDEKSLLIEQEGLIQSVEEALEDMKNDPYQEAGNHEQKALDSYNRLRSLAHVEQVKGIEDIKSVWLKRRDFTIWKELKKLGWRDDGYIFLEAQIANLLWLISEEQSDLEQAIFHTEKLEISRSYLFAYNFLRELLHAPLAKTIHHVDKEWLQTLHLKGLSAEKEIKNVAEALEIGSLLTGALPATLAQKQLVKEAQAIIGLKDKLLTLWYPDITTGGQVGTVSKSKAYIALCQEPDLDAMLFTIYHELGHIIHDDHRIYKEIEEGKLSPSTVNRRPDVRKDLKRVNHYRELGKNVLDDTTSIGRNMREIIAKKPALWEIPPSREDYNELLRSRIAEKRADLFALDTLLEQNKISTILTDMHLSAPTPLEEDKITAGEDSTHPSDFERVLYMAGFLADHGIDVNKALKEWLSRAICLPAEVGGFLPPGASK